MLIGLSIIMIVMWRKERWQAVEAREIWKKWMKKNWTKRRTWRIWKKRVQGVGWTGANGKGTMGKACLRMERLIAVRVVPMASIAHVQHNKWLS
jgi:hypothetical protein